jgi:excisionase family DNA binding protein
MSLADDRRPHGRLLTVNEAAARLGISAKTLRGHIRAGRLRYLSVGLGERRQAYRIEENDLEAFKEAIGRRNPEAGQCRSTARRTRRIINTTSNSGVTGFTALRDAKANAKPKRLSA